MFQMQYQKTTTTVYISKEIGNLQVFIPTTDKSGWFKRYGLPLGEGVQSI